MREDLLHYIWKTNKLQGIPLQTTANEPVIVESPGIHNQVSGPDFFNAKVHLADQLWAGNVEMHIKASDWYAHHHETDAKYDNVILHVVWEDDVAIFRKDGSQIPSLELKDRIPTKLLNSYKRLFDTSQKQFINCEKDIAGVSKFTVGSWLERLYIERLEQKAYLIFQLLQQSNNDWEQVLFTLLLKNFGSKVNGEAFLGISNILDFSVVRKIRQDIQVFESVLMGVGGLLEHTNTEDAYYKSLQTEFGFQQQKFQLKTHQVRPPEFFGLRPNNFPTIRLSQLANLYARQDALFSKVMEAGTVEKIYALFETEASPYWKNHFTFGKVSKSSQKKLTKSFIDLIVINTVVPLKFAYAKKQNTSVDEQLIALLSALKPEKNSIVDRYGSLGVKAEDAFKSQAVLQLHTKYCSQNQCLKCAIGTSLLS